MSRWSTTKDSMAMLLCIEYPVILFILVQRCTYLHQCRKLWYVQMSKHNWHYALIKKHRQLDLRLVLSLRFTKEWLQSVLIAETFITEILWLKLQLIQVQINLLKWSHGWDMIVPLCCRFAWMSGNGTQVAWLNHHIMQLRLWLTSVTRHALYVYLLTQLFGMTCQIRDTKMSCLLKQSVLFVLIRCTFCLFMIVKREGYMNTI